MIIEIYKNVVKYTRIVHLFVESLL